jgi:beta-lactamase superfamily II metal-dependent hydrolase
MLGMNHGMGLRPRIYRLQLGLLRVALIGGLLAVTVLGWSKAKTGPDQNLQISFIDVEGGQATLFVTPSGQSMLIDTGWPGFEGRDAKRIVAAAKASGLKKIDYVVVTHYHTDHVGGVPELAKRIKIGTFVDHGPNQEDSDVTRKDFGAYQKVIAHAKRIVAKPGDTIPVQGMQVQVLTAAGEHIAKSVDGGGQPNEFCSSEPAPSDDPTENARSVGVLITFGIFRVVDLGDLTKKKELELMCPTNPIGKIDLLIVSHHGWKESTSAALVDALHPRVAVMDNGARKGGSPEAWQTVRNSPGLEDLWQVHTSGEGGKEHNVAEDFIANTGEGDQDKGNSIRVAAGWDGTFTVVNTRNGFEKTYRK